MGSCSQGSYTSVNLCAPRGPLAIEAVMEGEPEAADRAWGRTTAHALQGLLILSR